MKLLTILATLSIAAPALGDGALGAPGPGEGTFSIGAAVLASPGAEGAVPFARISYARGLDLGLSARFELDTMGLASLATAGLELRRGDHLFVGVGARAGGGLAVLPDFFGETLVLGVALLAPRLSLGVADERMSFTLEAEAMFLLSDEASFAPRATGTLAFAIGDAGALGLEGGILADTSEGRVFPAFGIDWRW